LGFARLRVVGDLALLRAAGFGVAVLAGCATASVFKGGGASAEVFSIAALLVAGFDFACFAFVDFAVAGFDFAFAVSTAVAAVFVAQTRVVRRTLDAAVMRR
jgi:hypothetical protein